MKPNEKLFEALGSLDGDLLDDMEEHPLRSLGWAALAACLTLLLFRLWAGTSVGVPLETMALQILGTEGVQVVILERSDFEVLVPEGELLALTDYVVQVQNSYSGDLDAGETITIRTARNAMDVRQGTVLLAFLNQVEDSSVYVPAEGTTGIYAVSGNEAIPITGGASVSVESVITALSGK